jgi:TetR/AcrR family transcriptional regulator, repressor for uid operon
MSLTGVSDGSTISVVVTVHPVDAATVGELDRREAQRLATREKLLEISVAEFQGQGVAHVDISTIVERAGVSRGTFYFHFSSKDDVLAELRLREERRIAEEVFPRIRDGERLETVLRAVVSGILDAEERLGANLGREICAVQFRSSMVESDSPSNHPVAEVVLAAVAGSSKVARRSADVAVIFLIGIFALLSTHSGRSEERDRLIDTLVALTVKGLSPR